MRVNTTRFGELEVDKKDVINFKDGVLGFEQLKHFFVVDPGDQTLILWFQSIDDEATAFPIIEPKIFNPNYSIHLLPIELASLNLESVVDASVYTILTIPKNVNEMSANLKAPIIINNKTKLARQIVLQNSKLEVQYPMYTDLKRYIVNYHSDDSKRTRVDDPSQNAETSEASVDVTSTDATNKATEKRV